MKEVKREGREMGTVGLPTSRDINLNCRQGMPTASPFPPLPLSLSLPLLPVCVCVNYLRIVEPFAKHFCALANVQRQCRARNVINKRIKRMQREHRPRPEPAPAPDPAPVPWHWMEPN